MATTPAAVSATAYTYSDTTDLTDGLRKRVVEDFIYSIDPRDLPMRDYFGGYEKEKVESITFEFPEDTHIAIDTTIGTAASGWNTTTDAVDLSVTDQDVLCVGDILLTADGEIVVVSKVPGTAATANTIDVYSRADLGSTESVTNSNSDVIYIIGNAQLEGWTYGASPRFMTRGTKKNYVQNFEASIDVSKDYNVLPKWGIKEEFAYQLKQNQLRELKLLERNALYGGSNTDTLEGTASHPRTMCGIIAPITSVAANINIQTNTTNLSAVEVTEDNINSEMQAIYSAGGNPDTVMCGPFNKRVISSLLLPYRKADMSDEKYKNVVSTYENDYGTVTLLLNRYMRASDIVILDKKNFNFCVFKAFDVTDLPDDRDKVRSALIGKYSCKLVKEEHAAFIYGTSTS